jgi:glycerate kinase
VKIVIAPDSFKDALSAVEAAEAIAHGVRDALPEAQVLQCPIADGGEGFAATLATILNATAHRAGTSDALGRAMQGRYFITQGETAAVLELAEASGLQALTASERNPERTSTFGTGRLLDAALRHGVREVLLGIGGSATHDGACGLAQAMGVVFVDEHGCAMTQPITGRQLRDIARIDVTPLRDRLQGVRLRVACDVRNPLTGEQGAAHVYAPQKGADQAMVHRLDDGLRHLASLWRRDCGIDVEQLPGAGAGAAGGAGGGLVAMLSAELIPGADLVLDAMQFEELLRDASLVITGEGRLDGQSLQGKAVMTVARRSQQAGVRCVALVGCTGPGAELAPNEGLSRYVVIGEGLPQAESIQRTAELLRKATHAILS